MLLFPSHFKIGSEALNDDLSLSLTVHQVAETRSSHDRQVDANKSPENIICSMTSGSLIGQSINDI